MATPLTLQWGQSVNSGLLNQQLSWLVALEIQLQSILRRIPSQVKCVRLNQQKYSWTVGVEWGKKSYCDHDFLATHPTQRWFITPEAYFFVPSENRSWTPKHSQIQKSLIFIKESSFNGHKCMYSKVNPKHINYQMFSKYVFYIFFWDKKTRTCYAIISRQQCKNPVKLLTVWQVWTNRQICSCLSVNVS